MINWGKQIDQDLSVVKLILYGALADQLHGESVRCYHRVRAKFTKTRDFVLFEICHVAQGAAKQLEVKVEGLKKLPHEIENFSKIERKIQSN